VGIERSCVLDELYGGPRVSAAVEAGVDTTARAAGEEMCGRREWLALHVDGQCEALEQRVLLRDGIEAQRPVSGQTTSAVSGRTTSDVSGRTATAVSGRTATAVSGRTTSAVSGRTATAVSRLYGRVARRSEKAVSVLVSHTDVCLPVYGRDGAG